MRKVLERHPESELRGAVLGGDPLAIVGAALLCFQRPVRTVEDVERLSNQIDRDAVRQRNPLLDADGRIVLRRLNEGVLRDDRAIRAQAQFAAGAKIAPVAAIVARRAITGAPIVQATQLEAATHLPDPVEDGAMPLVALRIRPAGWTAEIF